MHNFFSELIRNLSKDKHFKELTKGTISALSLKIVGLLMGYIFTFIIAKFFGSEVLGNFVLAGIIISLLSILSVLGFDNTILVFSSQSDDKIANTNLIFNSYLVIIPFSIILSIILFFASFFISHKIFNNSNLALVLQISSLCILPFSLIKLNSQFLRGKKKINLFIFYSLISIYFLSSILLLIGTLFNKSYEVVIIPFIISVYLASILSTISLLKYLSFSQLALNFEFKKYFLYSHPILYSDLLKSIKQWIGPLLLGYFLFESEVGVFTITYKLATVSSILIYSVNSLAMPKYGELYGSNDVEGIQKTLNASSKLAFWLTLPVVFIVIISSNILLNLFGSDFSHSFYPLIILSLGQLAECFSASTNYFLQVVEQRTKYLMIVSVSTAIIIIASILLIPYFKLNGVALAYSVGTIMQVILTIFYINKNMGLLAFYQPLNSMKKLWSNLK